MKSLRLFRAVIGTKFRTVLYRLILTNSLSVALTALIVGTLSYGYYSASYNGEIEKVHSAALRHTSDLIDNLILKKTEQLALNVAADTDVALLFDHSLEGRGVAVLDSLTALKEAGSLNQEFVDSISVYYRHNRLVISSTQGINYLDDPTGKMSISLDWLERMESGGDNQLWLGTRPVPINVMSGQPHADVFTFVTAYPFRAKPADRLGYVAVHVKERAVYQMIRSLESADGSQLAVVDAEGRPISASASWNAEGGRIAAEIAGTEQRNGHFIDTVSGERSAVTYASIPTARWKLVQVTPVAQFYEKSAIILRSLLASCLIAAATGILLSVFFGVRLYNPLKTLVSFVRSKLEPAAAPGGTAVNEYAFIHTAFRQLADKMTELEATLVENVPVIKHHLVVSLFHRTIGTQAELDERLRLLGLSLPHPYCRAVLIELDTERMAGTSLEEKQFAVYSLIRELETGGGASLAVSLSDHQIAAVFPCPDEGDAPVRAAVEAWLAYAKQHFGLQPVAAIGPRAEGLLNLYASYEKAVSYLSYRYLLPKLKIFDDEALRLRETAGGEDSERWFAAFDEALRSRNVQGAADAVNGFVRALQTGTCPVEHAKLRWTEFAGVFYRFVKDVNLNVPEAAPDGPASIARAPDIDTARDRLLEAAQRAIARLGERTANRGAELVERIKRHIEEHLGDDLSLKALADLAGMNATYISEMFKEETGVNYIDHVTNRRLERAGEYMATTDLSVEQIARLVGYNSTAHFIKKFREKYGMTPKTYKMSRAMRREKPALREAE